MHLTLFPLVPAFASPGPILIQVGPLTLRWYGLLIAAAVIMGTFLAQWVAQYRYSQRWKAELLFMANLRYFGVFRAYWLDSVARRRAQLDRIPDLIYDLVFWLILSAIPAARAYYVAFSWDRYQNVYSTLSIGGVQISVPAFLAIWEGGIAIHGAILGGTLGMFLFALKHRVSFWRLTDAVVPALILGQSIGRWGNFFNSEAFGNPTNLPWKLYIPPEHRPPQYRMESYFHPTFLYESVWNLGVWGLLMMLLLRFPRLKPGTLLAVYMVTYSAGRIWIEGLRTDSLMAGPLRVAQLVSVGAMVVGLVALGRLYGKRTA